jgi:hypothetical protein
MLATWIAKMYPIPRRHVIISPVILWASTVAHRLAAALLASTHMFDSHLYLPIPFCRLPCQLPSIRITPAKINLAALGLPTWHRYYHRRLTSSAPRSTGISSSETVRKWHSKYVHHNSLLLQSAPKVPLVLAAVRCCSNALDHASGCIHSGTASTSNSKGR